MPRQTAVQLRLVLLVSREDDAGDSHSSPGSSTSFALFPRCHSSGKLMEVGDSTFVFSGSSDQTSGKLFASSEVSDQDTKSVKC